MIPKTCNHNRNPINQQTEVSPGGSPERRQVVLTKVSSAHTVLTPVMTQDSNSNPLTQTKYSQPLELVLFHVMKWVLQLVGVHSGAPSI
ncbi:hypothetical protein DEO72_LG2g3026 [Vigna unguiculata]|uniref:Uncharacterized protein n=1 Tax=Vigna unguiculata TaxID=3917 RepID=A0A4D6L2J1_VIGUN|nr:hypothetical protein DEO72_LG2g3026 [Vigna unguiculata]